jgi:hypothetical protein
MKHYKPKQSHYTHAHLGELWIKYTENNKI